MLNPANAQELAQIARETGARVLRGQLRYPGPDSGDWEIGADSVPEALYSLRDCQALLIPVAVDGEGLSRPARRGGQAGIQAQKERRYEPTQVVLKRGKHEPA